jgi:hypothetical protein
MEGTMIISLRGFAAIPMVAFVAITIASATPLPPLPFFQHTTPEQSGATSITLPQAQKSLDSRGAVFIENRGQWDRQVKFLLKSSGLDMWVTQRGVRYDLYSLATADKPSDRDVLSTNPGVEPPAMTRSGHVIGVCFEGAGFAPQARGVRQQPGAHNYFIGNDRSKWASGVRLFAETRLENLYEGIDALFYLDGGRPRYDLHIQPGADPAQIVMKIEGSNGVSVNADGSLAIQTTMGVLQQQGLYAYQEVNGVRQQVACQFVVGKDMRVQFGMGSYDKSRPLVIDPLVYSTYLGGDDMDEAGAIKIDDSGNVYIIGSSQSPDFPILNQYQAHVANRDVVITKLANDGSGNISLAYSTYFGSGSSEYGIDLAIDGKGGVYVTGWTHAKDFPVVNEYQTQQSRLYSDVYVAKLIEDGSGIVSIAYSTYLGGEDYDYSYGIAIDNSGNAYVTGSTSSTEFPAVNAMQPTYQEGQDAFVTKLAYNGSGKVTVEYSTYLGGSGVELGYDIAVDGNGNVYTTGWTMSADFPTVDAYQTFQGGSDVYVVKLVYDGEDVRAEYSTCLGGSNGDEGRAIAVDAQGNAYVTGFTYSSNFPIAHDYRPGPTNQNPDVFVLKLIDDGGRAALLFSTCLGSTGAGVDIAVDGNSVYITGSTSSANFPLVNPHQTYQAGSDAFVTKMTYRGSGHIALDYSTYLGGKSNDWGEGIAVDADGNIYVAGHTQSANFPTMNPYQTKFRGMQDLFVAKLNPTSSLDVPVTSINGASARNYHAVAPNPARDNLLCTFTLPTPIPVTMQIYTTDGQLVSVPVHSQPYEAGTHSQNIPVSELPPGIYTLRVLAGAASFVEQFVIVR